MAKRVPSIVSMKQKSSPDWIFETRIDIDQNTRQQLIAILNARLADTLDVQSQAKFAHWNVKGKDFHQLHLLFDSIAEHLEEGVDSIAERVTALGGVASGTVRQAAAASQVPEFDFNTKDGMEIVRVLSDRLAALSNGAREAIDETDELGDKATADLFTELVRAMDKDLYFLEAHLR